MSERDIVIYMNEGDFKHKTQKTMIAYWSMKRTPKHFERGGRVGKIFLAYGGRVRGYVDCLEFNPSWNDDDGETLVWKGKTFQKIKAILCKPFRGFRYRWFELASGD